ncbi:unnamed protein product [Paramecium pentaurelia]|uniref:Smr domain-containing protein n=1 Tax=Paramecium pentaurelia TaxID=43138 RepID=A0A8S1VKE9_9CILI|nr:unnamed protein product [Paramecium pentaurelia]
MSQKIKILSTSTQRTSNDEKNDFCSVFLGFDSKDQKNAGILNQEDAENDFHQFLDNPNLSKSQKDDKNYRDLVLNQLQGQDGSTQFKQNPLENQSNQNSGAIPLEDNYNQYSNNLNEYITHYNCQKSNQISQNFNNNPDFYYEDYGGVQNIQDFKDPIYYQDNENKEFNVYERYYKDEKCPYLQPIQVKQLDQDGMIYNQQYIYWNQDEKEPYIQQQNDEIINQDNGQIKKKTNKRGNRKNKNKKRESNNEQEDKQQIYHEQHLQQKVIQDNNTESTNQFDNGNMEELDDAVSDEFKIKITNFLEQNDNTKISLTKTIYGNEKQSIKIIEIIDYENQIQKLCKQFSNLKYSEIALSLQLIINFENCQQFLQTLKPKEEKLILREINQLIVDEQKAIESKNKDELTKSQYKIEEFKKVNQIQNIEGQSLYQTAIKIIEQKNFKFDIKKCDQQTKQQKKADFELNRNQVIAINNQKAKVIKQYQTCNINENQCNQQLQQIRLEKKKLEKIGRNLFLDLMVIDDNGFCRIDFHKFFSAEIENILDGVFEKIESYKLCNQQKQIKLQIIVGKGLHSKNQKPIIGPITKQYIQQYLQQQVEIIEGKIDFDQLQSQSKVIFIIIQQQIMIKLFLRLLSHFLFYWTIYIIYINIYSIFEQKLSLLEFLTPTIDELIYLSFSTLLTIKWYLIQQLFNLLFYLISTLLVIVWHFLTYIPSIISQLDTWFLIISTVCIIIILINNCKFGDYEDKYQQVQYQNYQVNHKFPENNFENYYFTQNNDLYKTRRNSYSTFQTKSYSQNKRQQSQNKQIEKEERKKLIQKLNENRVQMKLLQQNKGEIFQLKKEKEIKRVVIKDALQICIQKIETLQEEGKELFLKLINIEDGICRVDFHNFYKVEIKALLDGLLEQIRLYKYRLGYKYVKLKIIVGKGNHSKNGIPIIGPQTQEYLKEYLQEEVEIQNGFIEVQV